MKQKIKDFFIILWYYITFPYYFISTRKVRRWLEEAAAADRAALLTERDVEFLRSIGVETTLEELRESCYPKKKHKTKKKPGV